MESRINEFRDMLQEKAEGTTQYTGGAKETHQVLIVSQENNIIYLYCLVVTEKSTNPSVKLT